MSITRASGFCSTGDEQEMASATAPSRMLLREAIALRYLLPAFRVNQGVCSGPRAAPTAAPRSGGKKRGAVRSIRGVPPMRILPVIVVVLTCTAVSTSAFAWGATGHRVVASLGERNVSAKTRAALKQLLPAGSTLADVAMFADKVKAQRPTTKPWHFVDIPKAQAAYDPAKDCKENACVAAQVVRHATILKNMNASKKDRLEALKFLVHLVGDLHQPLHAADDKDRGGNDKKVSMDKLEAITIRPAGNLHAVWDDDVIEANDLPEGAYLNELSALTAEEKKALRACTVEDWVNQTHQVGKIAYEGLPKPDSKKIYHLDDDYFEAAMPAADLQLQRAGLRLARLLDESLGGAKPPPAGAPCAP